MKLHRHWTPSESQESCQDQGPELQFKNEGKEKTFSINVNCRVIELVEKNNPLKHRYHFFETD